MHENKRGEGRVRTQFETLYSAGRTEGAGIIADISYSGALISEASLRPDIGDKLRLYVFVQPVSPFELIGSVVRYTEDGFAIEYEVSDPDVCRLVDDAAAIVNAPSRS